MHGFELGGFSSGLTQGLQTSALLNRNALQARGQEANLGLGLSQIKASREAQKEKIQAQGLMEKRKALLADVKSVESAIAEIAKTAGPDAATSFLEKPEVQKVIETLNARLADIGVNADIAPRLFIVANGGVSPKEKAVMEMQGKIAAADVVAKTAGVSPRAALEGQGILPPEQFKPAIDGNGQPVFATEEMIRSGKVRPLPSGIKLSVDKDGNVSFATGTAGVAGGLTTGTRTLSQRAVSGASEVTANLARLRKMIEKGGLGVVGGFAALTGLLNKTLAQATPDIFDRARADFENALRFTVQAALRTISQDSRFTNEDREAIQDLFPSTGILESPQNAESKIATLEAALIRRLGQQLRRQDVVDNGILAGETPERIRELMQRGLLSLDEAENALKRLFPDRFD